MSLDIAAAYSNTRKLNKTILRQSLNQPTMNPLPVATNKSVLGNPLKSIAARKTLVSSIDMSTKAANTAGHQAIQHQIKMMQTRNVSKKLGVTVHPQKAGLINT